jgi:hypothetical protein
MEKRFLFCLIGLFVANCAYAQAYTWTDEDGIVHYSDTPHPGAREVDLGKYRAPTSAPRPAPRQAAPVVADDDEPDVFRYDSLAVASPAPEQTLWNIGGVLNVSLALSPALRPGHQVRVYFDGNPQEVSGLSFQLQEVYRGIHNLQAEVVDQAGQLMIRSEPSRFYVQQTSIIRR